MSANWPSPFADRRFAWLGRAAAGGRDLVRVLPAQDRRPPRARLWQTVEQLKPLAAELRLGDLRRRRQSRPRARRLWSTALRERAGLAAAAASDLRQRARAPRSRRSRARYWAAGVRQIVALRGDRPKDAAAAAERRRTTASPPIWSRALRRIGDFEISVAAYPETHPEAASPAADLDNLKRKLDAGASRAITQYCFDTETVLRFRDRMVAAGITAPLAVGIMPVHDFGQVRRFSERCGAGVPGWLGALFEGLDDDPAERRWIAACVAAEQARRLIVEGIRELHFYTLNRAELTIAACRLLGLRAAPRPRRRLSAQRDGRFPRHPRAPRAAVRRRHGHPDPGPRALGRGRLLGQGELLRDAQPEPARPDRARSTAAISRPAPMRSRPTASAARRSRSASSTSASGRSRSTGAPPSSRARRSPQFAGDGRARFVIGAIGPGTRLPSLGHIAYRTPRAGVRGPGGRPDRGRRRRDPVRDLPGPAPGQGRGQRRPASRCARPAGSCRSWSRSRSRPPARMLVGTDIAAARDHRRRARRADHRPQLRDRPAGDGRAPGAPRRELAGADLGAAERRPARAGRRPDPLSARRPRARRLARALRHRGRRRRSSAAAAAPRPSTSGRSTRMLRRLAEDG